MIISKKKYQEDIRKAVDEALNRVEKEQWMNERIQRIERECNESVDCLHRRIADLEERMEALDHSKDRMAKRWRR